MSNTFFGRLFPWFFVLLAFVLASCGGTTTTGIALPPPVHSHYQATLVVRSDNTGTDLNVLSPLMNTQFGDSAYDSMEKVILPLDDSKQAVMQRIIWNDWDNGEIRTTAYDNAQGDTIGGVVTESVTGGSIFQWVRGDFSYTVDRSRLDFVYALPPGGYDPQLVRIVYTEAYGFGGGDLPLGRTLVWDASETNLASIISPSYTTWGFWEQAATPYDMITAALGSANDQLQSHPADYEARHDLALSDIVGRHPGLSMYRHGKQVGTVDISYDNNVGRSPNTTLLSSSALSKVEWDIDGHYYALLVITPDLAATPSSLFIFTDSQETEARVESYKGWTSMYADLREGSIPGVFLAIHMLGDVTKSQGSGSSSNGDSVSTDNGDGGGIAYSSFTTLSFPQASTARALISMLGQPAIQELGMYYPTSEGSGNGLYYYLAMLNLMTADPATVFAQMGINDVGVLDRTGLDMPVQPLSPLGVN